MRIELTQGDVLHVTLADTDGEFEIGYLAPTADAPGRLSVYADLPDSYDRTGTIYEEFFGRDDAKDVAR